VGVDLRGAGHHAVEIEQKGREVESCQIGGPTGSVTISRHVACSFAPNF
jgi:hypothetical protein